MKSWNVENPGNWLTNPRTAPLQRILDSGASSFYLDHLSLLTVAGFEFIEPIRQRKQPPYPHSQRNLPKSALSQTPPENSTFNSHHTSPPPSYPAQAHDAGPYYPNSPPPQGQSPGAANDYYGGGQPQQQSYYPPQQGYGQPQQQGYYPQGQPMYYPPQQQGYPPQQQQGYYANDRGNSGGGAGGICAGIMAAMACCCCLDILF
ncbi:hypothetical protein N7517_003401 [Penicillium concentricum]|uniref:Cysteine-rich transmembrane CYSTM domain-containing protein n=1 Tax=Penicillium concentricum TaxID=293559 RepID=A0A9W9SVU1_9EURO|nr:uncharacterized protein N7517_003401 [Penicillium concentricum]KAJ5385490.1 hypothetical protein N7517_003401 [Penicillium concentricum]